MKDRELVEDQKLGTMKWQVCWAQPGDEVGQRLMMIWQAAAGEITAEELAKQLGVMVRTARGYIKSYQESGNSLRVIDRRHFNGGQQVAYRLAEHRGDVAQECVLRLLKNKPLNGRQLEQGLGEVLDDRTLDRYLERSGFREAERAGVREKVGEYLAAERKTAYLAGIAGEPLVEGKERLQAKEWGEAEPGEVGVSLGLVQLERNGSYASLEKLVEAEAAGGVGWRKAHKLLVYQMANQGERLSGAKTFLWGKVKGILGGEKGSSASGLLETVKSLAKIGQEQVAVERAAGQVEEIERVRDYQEESIAQKAKRGLISGKFVWLDDYVNGVYRSEALGKTKHGTKNRVMKAFRRHVVQDVESGYAVSCPVGRSDVKSVEVLAEVVGIIKGGLQRVPGLAKLKGVIADRWWSNQACLSWAQENETGLLVWNKEVKTVNEAMEKVAEQEWLTHPVEKENDEGGNEPDLYRMEKNLEIYGLDEPVRAVMDWERGPADGEKRARLAVGIKPEEMDSQQVVEGLRFRQRVEILIKKMLDRVHLSNFGGGAAQVDEPEPITLNAEVIKKWEKNRKHVQTLQKNRQQRLDAVEKELLRLQNDKRAKPDNSFHLGQQELKKLSTDLQSQIAQNQSRLQALDTYLAWGRGEGSAPEQPTVASLDLTREAILTQIKLDIFTAQESLLDEFIEVGYKPVLRAEAEKQASERQQYDKRSTAKGKIDQPLPTKVETLYQTKVTNLERDTILTRLLQQPGEFLLNHQQRIVLSVFQRFENKRMQAAFERYCVFLNQQQIRVPMDDGKPWLLLFTYHKDKKPPSSRV